MIKKILRALAPKTYRRGILRVFAGLFLCTVCGGIFAQNTEPGAGGNSAEAVFDVPALLAAYLSGDAALAEKAIALQEARLSLGKTLIEQGFTVQFSTGNMVMRYHPDSSSWDFSPELSASFPVLNGVELGVSVPVKIDSEGGRLENTALSGTFGIITPGKGQRELERLRAERAELAALRALAAQGLISEKAFYTELGALYKGMENMLSLRDAQYSKELALAGVRAQGYTEASARFRTAEMEAASARYAADEAGRNLSHSLEAFSRRCKTALTMDDVPGIRLAPPEGPMTGFEGHEKNLFTDIEAAEWAHFIGEKTRAAKGGLTLNSTLGLTFNDTLLARGTSVRAGLSLGWRGLKASLEAAFPLGENDTPFPVFTGTLRINPLEFRTAAFGKRQDSLDVQKELLALKNANERYDDAVFERSKALSDILWREHQRNDEAGLYAELAADMEGWYKRGVVTETEYRQALANHQRAQIALLQIALEKIIYRLDTKLAFTEANP